MTPRRILLLLSLIGCVFSSHALRALASSPSQTDTFKAVDAFVEAQMARHRIPGLALVITKDDEVVYLRGYGTAGDGRDVTPETPFYIGSVSKSFTAMAVMKLVEAGKIELDAPVRRYLPWFQVADGDASSAITVRHLLHQSSGLSEASHGLNLPTDATLEEVVRDLARATPADPPGAAFHYFNQNYTTLGLIVEAVSGQPYGDYVQDHILAPLQMNRSASTPEAQASLEIAQGHGLLFGFPLPRDETIAASGMPSGGIVSTAKDMGRYLIAQMNGGRYGDDTVLPPELVKQMHQPDTPGAPEGEGYAMGWIVESVDGVRAVHHGGSLDNYRTFAWLLPTGGYAFAVLINQNGFVPSMVAYSGIPERILALLVGQSPDAGLALGAVYGAVTAIFAVMVVSDLRWWWKKLPAWRERTRAVPLPRVVVKVALHLVGPVVLLALPHLLLAQMDRGFTWALGFRMEPTLMIVLVWGAVMGTAKSVALAAVAWGSRRS